MLDHVLQRFFNVQANPSPDDFMESPSHTRAGKTFKGQGNRMTFLAAMRQVPAETKLGTGIVGALLGGALFVHDYVLGAKMVDRLADLHKEATGKDVPRIKTSFRFALLRSAVFALAFTTIINSLAALQIQLRNK